MDSTPAPPLQLVFRGECLEGADARAVRAAMAQALKLDDRRARHLFSGRPVVLRRNVDEVAAANYIARFALMGAVLHAEPALRRHKAKRRRARWWWPLATVGALAGTAALAWGLLAGPAHHAGDPGPQQTPARQRR